MLASISVSAKKVLTATAAIIIATQFQAGAYGAPKYGRPRYEVIDGKEWLFYLTENDTDWYLEPRGQHLGGIFKILIRGVSPGTDNFGVLQIDCVKRLVSAYHEEWEEIPEDSVLINKLYLQFCNF